MAKVFSDLRKAPNGKFFIKKTDEGMICERSTRYLFPSLVRARKQFQDYIGVPIRWNEEVDEWQSDPTPNDEEPDHDVF